MTAVAGYDMSGGYGGADILHACTIEAASGEITVIVGPNGAGKSTALRAMFGLLTLRQGRVLLHGEDITHVPPQLRVGKAMGFVPQTDNIFAGMTVRENLQMGAFIRQDDYSETMDEVLGLFPILRDKYGAAAGSLSGGQRQQLAVARALMMRPQVLFLDEPTAGVSPIVIDDLFEKILAIAATGIAILMVEQNARHALEIAHRAYVLVQGENRYQGSGKELLADKQVRKSFLGG